MKIGFHSPGLCVPGPDCHGRVRAHGVDRPHLKLASMPILRAGRTDGRAARLKLPRLCAGECVCVQLHSASVVRPLHLASAPAHRQQNHHHPRAALPPTVPRLIRVACVGAGLSAGAHAPAKEPQYPPPHLSVALFRSLRCVSRWASPLSRQPRGGGSSLHR